MNSSDQFKQRLEAAANRADAALVHKEHMQARIKEGRDLGIPLDHDALAASEKSLRHALQLLLCGAITWAMAELVGLQRAVFTWADRAGSDAGLSERDRSTGRHDGLFRIAPLRVTQSTLGGRQARGVLRVDDAAADVAAAIHPISSFMGDDRLVLVSVTVDTKTGKLADSEGEEGVLRVLELSVVAGGASGTLRVRMTTSKEARAG